ncbi:MAG: hypothetical protein PF481_05475 [Bacteroidales bacterium]|jgi:hypothetical protein|nr:hypothetical protein [Bacteroidales bacterium]
MKKRYIVLLCLCGSLFFASAQKISNFSNSFEDSTQQIEKRKYDGIRFSGYVRSVFFYRDVDVYELGDQGRLTLPKNISLGDAYDEPIIHLEMNASPFPATNIATELAFDNRLLRGGSFNETVDENGRMGSAWHMFNFKAETFTSFGSFKLTAGGGVNWFRMTPLIMWSANDFNSRIELFDRMPWEYQSNDFERYSAYYNQGDIPREDKVGNSSTQGVILEGFDLPGQGNAALVVGKASGSAGFQSWEDKRPQNLMALRLNRAFGKHSFGVNYINQFGHVENEISYTKITKDSEIYYIDATKISQLATTVDGLLQLNNNIRLNFEIGAGSYLSQLYNDGLKENIEPGVENVSTYKRNWDELLMAEVTFANLPIRVQGYRIGEQFVNFASSVQNTSIEKTGSAAEQTMSNTSCYPGLIPQIGQTTNNRQGINAFFNKSFGDFKTHAGYGISQELTNFAGDVRNGARVSEFASDPDSATIASYTNSITFQHSLNKLARSRFGFWETNTGPYSRIHNKYRQSYENIVITDTVVDYKKSYASIELELKYKTILFNRPVIFTNYIQYNSVQENLSLIPKFNDEAFVRLLYNEFTMFYNIQHNITLVGLLGYETVQGNNRTELANENGDLILDENGAIVFDENGNPINQIDYGYGFGIDYTFASRASLHYRHRWYSHEDTHFILDTFKGNEATIELKIFF